MKDKDYRRIKEFEGFFFSMSERDRASRNQHYYQARKLIKSHIDLMHRIGILMSKKTSKKTQKFEFKGYANVAVDESHNDLIKKHIADTKAIYEDVNTLAIDGYSLKVYYDDEKLNYRASITCMNVDDDNWGYVLGSYAGDWFTAVAVLTYKHYHIAKENWLEYTNDTTGDFG